VSTWSGWVYVAFVIDAYSGRIVGWRTATGMNTQLVLDAIEHAIWTRAREGITDLTGLIDHHDRGAQYTAIAYTERLAEAGIDASIGTTGDSYDNALAETINGLYKTELIKPRRAMAHRRPRRDRHPRMGRLVQPPTSLTNTAATSRQPNSRLRTTVTKELSKPPSSQTSKSPYTPTGFRQPVARVLGKLFRPSGHRP
jgi:putative transposase